MNFKEGGLTEADLHKEQHVLSCLVDNLRSRITQEAQGNYPFFVGIGGFTALGKTTLAGRLSKAIPDSSVISTDSFILDRASRRKFGLATADDPKTIDFDGLLQAVKTLKDGNAVQVSKYNHVNGRHDNNFVVINPSQVIIIEGNAALYSQIQHVFQLRIFLDASQLIRKTLRKSTEMTERGHSEKEFENHWPSYKKDNELYIEPSKMNADIICNVDQKHRFSSDAIQTCSCQ